MFLLAAGLLAMTATPSDSLLQEFQRPPASARPWVYWYFMEGNMTREGMLADLKSMKEAGIGGAIFLEVDLGVPRGPVRYMSPEWRKMIGFAAKTADRLGIELAIGTGPGWCGTGGPWVEPKQAMQRLVSSTTEVTGPARIERKLEQPKPIDPFFGQGSLSEALRQQWRDFYEDEVVLAVPTPEGNARLTDLDEKALVNRAPFTSQPGVKPRLSPDEFRVAPGQAVASRTVINITRYLKNGVLTWDAPAGNWSILRFGRTLAGVSTRPAPAAGLGFETDKFEKAAINSHLDTFVDAIVGETGPNRTPGRGLTTLHFDSWEMSSQNWSVGFRNEFRKRRGYDPIPYLPVMAEHIVDSLDVSERFLWDLRQTAQELVIENHLGPIRARAKKYGLKVDVEPYDMNPTADLSLGATADVPMGEFWSKGYGYDSEYSIDEAVSIGHTNGKSIIAAEAFTADDRDGWLQHPASMKAQTDWALATGINRIAFHRFQHQPTLHERPGMAMGPYGVHWERTQTWWDMVGGYHAYISRAQNLLRKGTPVADILYLVPEGAPNVFLPPHDAKIGELPDRRGYNFDGCAPETLIARAQVRKDKIAFPDGATYRVLVLPRVDTMTPRLLAKIAQLVADGATVIGNPPRRSPSLVGYPAADRELVKAAAKVWSRVLPDKFDRGSGPRESIRDAKWIWADEGGDATSSSAPGTRRFERIVQLPVGKIVKSASASMTADNRFELRVNGHSVMVGSDFHRVESVDVTRWLRPGGNRLTVDATNDGPSANPAGLIGTLDIRFTDGSGFTLSTDVDWSSNGRQCVELGAFGIAPWGLGNGAFPRPDIYPTYAHVAEILESKLHVEPDLAANDALRYGHRKVGDADVYFVANRSEKPFVGDAAFRVVSKQPEWWDPMTGANRKLPTFRRKGNTTVVPLRLTGLQSGFVVFRQSGTKGKGINFATPITMRELIGPWDVQFDRNSGGPKEPLRWDRLSDWSTNPDEAIRHFSGKATYRTTFDAPKGVTSIALGEVKNMARVRVNGRDLGVVWCAPWSVEIPKGLLRPSRNELEITVANLWPNRLIGDAALPEKQRTTRTTWSPYGKDSPLFPSGLLGPVTLRR